MYTIYCHVFPNNKRYVGITKNDVEKRWNNGNGYKTCPLMDRAIRKYKWENIQHETLAIVETQNEAELLEKEYIEIFNSANPVFGYNILLGGDISVSELTDELRYKLGNGNRGKHRTDETKKKISDSVKNKFKRQDSNGHYGMKHSESTKQKMSISQKQRWTNELRKEQSNIMKERMSNAEYKENMMKAIKSIPKRQKGEFHQSESAKAKISKAMIGRWRGENSSTSKPIVQYTKDGQFIRQWASAGDAERAGFGNRRNISKCCNRAPHVHAVAGYIWRFVGDTV